MMQLEIGGRRHPIAAGETVIGSGPGCEITLDGDGVRPRHAVLHGTPAGAAIRAAAADAEVLVNGIRLGTDPTPVLHGDKIRIAGHELVAVDARRAGSTQLFDASAFDVAIPRAEKGAPVAGAASGGRLVCLTDGREYAVGGGLVLGRDAAADVVVEGSEVSRRHAEVRPGPDGYVLHDFSVNGTYVNGSRVEKTHPLAKGDVIRIANDEFRFHADVSKAPAGFGGRTAEIRAITIPPAVEAGSGAANPPAAPAGAAFQLADTMHGMPAAELRAVTPPLASFLVRSGAGKGHRLPVWTPVANIGRADYNDVVIADPSVSTAHAKLQRRDGLWMLADAGSTNGTFVDGEPVTDETPLLAGATVRFGEVAALFEPHDERLEATPAAGTRVMERIDTPAAAAAASSAPEPAGVPEPVLAEEPMGVQEPTPAPEPPPALAQEPELAPPAPRPRPRRPPRITPPPRRGLPGWAAALILAAAAAAGVAAAFVFLR